MTSRTRAHATLRCGRKKSAGDAAPCLIIIAEVRLGIVPSTSRSGMPERPMTPALRREGGLAVAPQEAPQEAPPGGTERSLWCGVVNPTASPSTLSCRAHYSIKKSLPVYYEAALPCLPSLSLSFLLPSLSGCSLSPQCLPSPLPLLSLSLGAPPLSSGRPVHLFLPPLSSFPSPSSSPLSTLSPQCLPSPSSSLLFLLRTSLLLVF